MFTEAKRDRGLYNFTFYVHSKLQGFGDVQEGKRARGMDDIYCYFAMTISAIYDAFAFFIDTCVKVCSRCTNGAQSASICAMWTTISAVYADFV